MPATDPLPLPRGWKKTTRSRPGLASRRDGNELKRHIDAAVSQLERAVRLRSAFADGAHATSFLFGMSPAVFFETYATYRICLNAALARSAIFDAVKATGCEFLAMGEGDAGWADTFW